MTVAARPSRGDVRLAGTAEPNPEPSPVRRTNDEEQLRDHRVEAAAIEGRHAGADGVGGGRCVCPTPDEPSGCGGPRG